MQIESRNLVNISLLNLAWEEFLVTQFSYGFIFDNNDNNIVYWTDISLYIIKAVLTSQKLQQWNLMKIIW